MRLRFAAALLGAMLPLAVPAAFAMADDRPADAILKDLDALERPKLDPEQRRDEAAVAAYYQAGQKYSQERSRLTVELLKSQADHPRLPGLLMERWGNPMISLTVTPEALIKEVDQVLATFNDEQLKRAGNFVKARAALQIHKDDPAAALAAVDEFINAVPQDQRAAGLLYAISRGLKDEAKQAEIEDRILKDFPNASVVRSIQGVRKQRESIGKPFALEFTDAINGSNVSIAGLKGKVVVIDFWATWCGPCVAEMPRMKKLYAEYKDKGVEFLGVSLDQPEDKGGLKALKEYVAKNEIAWPQYYQGNYWQSEFSSSWGINAIPALFVVDKDGNLASVEARHRLEALIPELLAKGTTPTP
ncbi:TlpA family protein disulfide reductase [Paludisphaera rhizosphaerae]|uniref:TlpA family protein disulfide reductase n=1 Tax=Paludisphaera rhizosphaerae TaxID=2711216 RepID=UPI0013EA57E9|nr:TlpA disulfide reductase family protein [Paludisphaera rhizosphaerae]